MWVNVKVMFRHRLWLLSPYVPDGSKLRLTQNYPPHKSNLVSRRTSNTCLNFFVMSGEDVHPFSIPSSSPLEGTNSPAVSFKSAVTVPARRPSSPETASAQAASKFQKMLKKEKSFWSTAEATAEDEEHEALVYELRALGNINSQVDCR